ncbi:hypothetical protein GCM10010470_34240 [Saccharopolyspora taberi]|uniref:DUF6801 domain-containing protein n=1 Tax=Saccharopolyspora taberi TaxID=60895 RepID=A0ABN3VE62_9PSEU
MTAVAGTVSHTTATTCAFPQGAEQVRAAVSATFPASAAPGPVRATGLSVALELPEPLVNALRASGTSRIGGTVDIRLTARHDGVVTDVSTGPVRIADTELPASGGLRIDVRGDSPAVTASGDVVFELHGVAAALTLHDPASGVACDPAAAQPAVLAEVPVAGATGPGAAPEPRPAPAAPAGLPVSYWIDNSVTRIQKLGSDMSIGRGRFDASADITQKPYPITGTLQMPPADGYFVTFGFVPVTNAVEMVQDGETTGNLSNIQFVPGGIAADVHTTIPVAINVRQINVDGVPVDPGPNCRTATPAAIDINARLTFLQDPSKVPPVPIETTFEIPPFAGCGATEDLDPLLTGLISGPGNKLTSTLVLRCFRNQNCPPEGA